MEIKELGEFAFIDRLTANFKSFVTKGIGDDAAVIDRGENYELISSDILMEGIHFDLTYTPLRHLGYKSVVVAISDILAMNGKADYLTISLGISGKFSVEMVEEIYSGVKIACDEYDVALIGGDTTSSLTGLTIALTAVGNVSKDKITYRSGAKESDLVCVTGDLGAALLGVKLLEREKYVLNGNDVEKPKFDGFEYPLGRALKPRCRVDIIKKLNVAEIVPSAMIDISDGLASELLHICKQSECGVDIYLDRIPISPISEKLAEELNFDQLISALNGGDDYELLFTVPVMMYDKISKIQDVTIIGHITNAASGAVLLAPDGSELTLEAPGWVAQK